jgi:hypothetical protein
MASSTVEVSMLPPLRTDMLVDASPLVDTRPVQPDHEPSWAPVVLALVLLAWALNWRRGKPGLIGAILRQLRR